LQAIGLTLYEHEDCCDPLDRPVRKTQWLTYSHVHGTNEAAVSLQGHTILIVDEVRQQCYNMFCFSTWDLVGLM
jgi:hypothetical protein